MKKKGASDARGVATFIGLFILFMIGYILLLPPSERDSLLLDSQKEDGRTRTLPAAGVLLDVVPGKVGSDSLVVLKEISNVDLFSTTEKSIYELIDKVYIRRTLVSNNVKSFDFNLENLGEIEKFSLYFYVSDHLGNLVVELNDVEFFNEEVSSEKLVGLPLGYLKEGKNTLTFMVSSPSSKFWDTNYYSLNDLRLIKEVKVENKEAETSFYISQDELNDLKSARFDYFVFCSSSKQVKQLFIFANEGLISSGVPVCDQFSSANIPEEYLKKGTNLLKFKIDEGDLIIERGEVGLELKSKKQLTYTFTLKDDDYWDVFDDRSMVFLTLAFSEISKGSYLDVFVNGNLINVDVDDGVYRDDVSSFIKDGKNVLMLIPSGNFEIESLVVSLE